MSSGIFLALSLLLQARPAKPQASALTYLKRVVQRYSDAKSYYIKATIVDTDSNALMRNWQKSILVSSVAPGGRYRYEGRAGIGSAVAVSNGTMQWDYHPGNHEYAEQAVSTGLAAEQQGMSDVEMGIMQAKNLLENIQYLADSLKSASFLPDQTITVDGRAIYCRVIHVTDADLKRQNPGVTTGETIWIDKARKVIVKTFNHGDSYLIDPLTNTRTPMKSSHEVVYSAVRLNAQEPESIFTFTPPPKARMVASLPGNSFAALLDHTAEFLDRPAPDILLKRDGKEIALISYRGKPVFIDFWEPSCGPCVAAMPGLKKLYGETHDKGMVWIGIDAWGGRATLESFLKQHPLPWPNYSDADGSLSKAFLCGGVPMGVLINSSGKVVFYHIGCSVAQVRAAIAKLGPEFSSLAEKSRAAGGSRSTP